MASQNRPALQVVYESPNSTSADIIAVHGLGANDEWTWTYKHNPDGHVRWLQDLDMLPNLIPDARIVLYNYNSTWHTDAPKTRLQLCGEDFIRNVRNFRKDTVKRPVVFVGHSLGGNVIQHGLLHAHAHIHDDFREILTWTAGVVFLGSPLRGSQFQPVSQVVANLLRLAGSHDGIIKELGSADPNLHDKLHQFCQIINTIFIPICCFFETRPSQYFKHGPKGMVVDEISACIDGVCRIPLQADHFQLNKFSGPHDRSFQSVSAELRRMCENAWITIQQRENPKPIIVDNSRFPMDRLVAKECLYDIFLSNPCEDMEAVWRKKHGRAKGTCDWILGTPELTTWLGDVVESTIPPRDILWLKGIPGTGKSTISMFLARELSDMFSKTAHKTISYFFCDSNYDTRKTATAVVRGLLGQLVRQNPSLIDLILPEYEEIPKDKNRAALFDSFDRVWRMFISACKDKATGRKYCLIDALDECEPKEQKILLKQIEETFDPDKRNGNELNVSLLITSRPYPEIDEYLRRYSNRDLRSFEESEQDIQRFIDEKVADLTSKKEYPSSVIRSVTQILREKAGGIFLWVGLACQELEGANSRGATARLKTIPTNLHSFYSELLRGALREEDEDIDTKKWILSCVLVARRPLGLLELASACELYPEQDKKTRKKFTQDIIEEYRLLLVIQDGKVFLLHQSVKDFLSENETGVKDFAGDQVAHARLAARCVNCLIGQLPGRQSESPKPDRILRAYAAKSWLYHARMAGEKFRIDDDWAKAFDIMSKLRSDWSATIRTHVDTARVTHAIGLEMNGQPPPFLGKEHSNQWPVIQSPGLDVLLRTIDESPHFRRIDVLSEANRDIECDSRCLAELRRDEQNLILINHQGVVLASREVSDSVPGLWVTASKDLVQQAEQLARAQYLLGLGRNDPEERITRDLLVAFSKVKNGDTNKEVIPTDGTGSVADGDSVYVSLENNSPETVYVSVFDINVAGKITLISSGHSGHGILLSPGGGYTVGHSSGLDVAWPRGISKTRPITESLLLIVADSPIDVRYLDSRVDGSRENVGISFLERLAFSLATGRKRDVGSDGGMENICYNALQIHFNLSPRIEG